MAINACSINGFTINGRRCSTNIAALIEQLHPTPAISGSARRERYIHQPIEQDERPQLVYEQPIVSVTVEILGFTGTDTQDVSTASAELVTVSNFEFDAISITITDINFE